MDAATARLLCCLMVLFAVPANGAGILSVRGDLDETSAPPGVAAAAVPDGSGEPVAAAAADPGEAPHTVPHSRLYVVTGARLQQSVLRGTVSGLNVGTLHTLSVGWAIPLGWGTGPPDQARAVPIAFWGLAFNVRTFAAMAAATPAEAFTPWMQQRFAPALEGGARMLPAMVVDPVPADIGLDQPAAAERADTSLVWSGERQDAPDISAWVVAATLLAFFGLVCWLVTRAARQNALEAQVSRARRLSGQQDKQLPDALDELAADWGPTI